MAMKARYTVVNGEIIAEKRGGVRRLYVPNPLGSTVALLDNTQAKTDTFEYWPYGEERSRTGTTPTPFRFGGAIGVYRDTASRLYVRRRAFRVTTGMWLSRDPIAFRGRDYNLYRFVFSRPTVFADRRGLEPFPPGGPCGLPIRRPPPGFSPAGPHGPWPGWEVPPGTPWFTYTPGEGWDWWGNIPARPPGYCFGAAWDKYCECLRRKLACCSIFCSNVTSGTGGINVPPFFDPGSPASPGEGPPVDVGTPFAQTVCIFQCMNQAANPSAGSCPIDCWGEAMRTITLCCLVGPPQAGEPGFPAPTGRPGQRCGR
jgi:RHS repeat-associated protein